MTRPPLDAHEPLLATTGEFRIATACPGCQEPVTLPATIDVVLKRARHGESTVRLSMKTAALPHTCDPDQFTLDVDTDTGEIM